MLSRRGSSSCGRRRAGRTLAARALVEGDEEASGGAYGRNERPQREVRAPARRAGAPLARGAGHAAAARQGRRRPGRERPRPRGARRGSVRPARGSPRHDTTHTPHTPRHPRRAAAPFRRARGWGRSPRRRPRDRRGRGPRTRGPCATPPGPGRGRARRRGSRCTSSASRRTARGRSAGRAPARRPAPAMRPRVACAYRPKGYVSGSSTAGARTTSASGRTARVSSNQTYSSNWRVRSA